MNYTMEQAKQMFNVAYLTDFRIDRSLDNEWIISLGKGMSEGFLIDARNKKVRTFKSLDSAVKTLESVGFSIDALFRG